VEIKERAWKMQIRGCRPQRKRRPGRDHRPGPARAVRGRKRMVRRRGWGHVPVVGDLLDFKINPKKISGKGKKKLVLFLGGKILRDPQPQRRERSQSVRRSALPKGRGP